MGQILIGFMILFSIEIQFVFLIRITIHAGIKNAQMRCFITGQMLKSLRARRFFLLVKGTSIEGLKHLYVTFQGAQRQ